MTANSDGLLRRYYAWVAGLLILIAAGDLGVIAYRKFVPGELTVSDSPSMNAQSRMDPNTASADDLECIPGLRKTAARAIVAYREEFRVRVPGRLAFENLQDLKNVRGIGDKTLLRLAPFLAFPTPPATSAPTARSGSGRVDR